MSKYKNKKVIVDEIKFDSKLESEWYLDNKHLNPILQPSFELQEAFRKNGKLHRAITYKADFQLNNEVIDVKGIETTDFKIKKKLFKYKYPELTLKVVCKCPKKYLEFNNNEKWIELDLLKRLRKGGLV